MDIEFGNIDNRETENNKTILNLQNIKAIIFDFDDTLYSNGDWSRYYDECLKYFEDYGYTDDGWKFYEMLKKKYPDIPNLGYKVCRYFKEIGGDVNFLYDRLNEHIYDITNPNLKFMDYSLLEKLSKKYSIYLISNSPENYIKHYAKLFGVDLNCFKMVLFNKHEGEDYSKGFYMEKCMKDAKTLPSETLMVGDDPYTDMLPAKNLKLNTFLVDDVSETEKLIKLLLKLKR